jgi:hypothetical protein
MQLTIDKRIQAFSLLGKELRSISTALKSGNKPLLQGSTAQEFFRAALDAQNQNPWFTAENVYHAIAALGEMLQESRLIKWVSAYPELMQDTKTVPKKVAVIMAGNIPMVGFHDFLCVLISGHHFLGKLSSQDNKLPVALGNMLIEIEPAFRESIVFSVDPLIGFEAVIATGSNNSARYFEHYFGKYPHIIRKNRNSVAVLQGDESPEELHNLGKDVFSFFGLGCRNVSKLLVPEGYNLSGLKEAWKAWEAVACHQKFFNNYEYFKAIFIVNRTPFSDTGFCLLRQDPSLSSPVSVVHFEEYPSVDWLTRYLANEAENIQCVVGREKEKGARIVPFGQSQQPELWDYADGTDTLKFLTGLSKTP